MYSAETQWQTRDGPRVENSDLARASPHLGRSARPAQLNAVRRHTRSRAPDAAATIGRPSRYRPRYAKRVLDPMFQTSRTLFRSQEALNDLRQYRIDWEWVVGGVRQDCELMYEAVGATY
jgi:hypothetical protein